MATCVKCKKEIPSTLKYCPYCGAKQNIYIDVNQVVSKNLIGKNRFDAQKDIMKAPRIDIIIDDSEAATPTIVEDVKQEFSVIEELPDPQIKEADNSNYVSDIEIALFNDVNERLNKAIEEEKKVEDVKQEEDIVDTLENDDAIKSKRINIFNMIFNVLLNGAVLFLVGCPYFMDKYSKMYFLTVMKSSKNDLPHFLEWSFLQHARLFGLISLFAATILFLIYIVKIIVFSQKQHKYIFTYYAFGASLSFASIVLFYNSSLDAFKVLWSPFFNIYSFVAIGLIVLAMVVNLICRYIDPLNLTFRWGYIRYNLENEEELPRLKGMNSSLVYRKVVYIILACTLLFYIYLIYLAGPLYNNFYRYFIPYVNFKSQFEGKINIFRTIKPMIDGYSTYVHKLFDAVHFVLYIIISMCIIGLEFISKKKKERVSRLSLLFYIVTYIMLFFGILRSTLTVISIKDGIGVNENVYYMITRCTFIEFGIFMFCFILLIVEHYTNKNIARKEMARYRQK